MDELDVNNIPAMLARLQAQAQEEAVEFTLHAQQEMAEEDIRPDDVLAVLASGQILENYPDHRRGACCLVYGQTSEGRHLHLVCTTARPTVILITAYEPLPPKWTTPTQRGPRDDL
jgi:hypothetical protein